MKLEAALSECGVVGLDTMVFIYHFEGGRYSDFTTEVFREIEEGAVKGVISTIAVGETLVRPFAIKDYELAERYRMIFDTFPNLEVVDVSARVATRAAEIRAKYGFTMPDSIHLATSIEKEADAFVTNDPKLKNFEDVEVMILDEYLSQ